MSTTSKKEGWPDPPVCFRRLNIERRYSASLFRNVVVAIVKIIETKGKTGCQLLAIDEPIAKPCPGPSHPLASWDGFAQHEYLDIAPALFGGDERAFEPACIPEESTSGFSITKSEFRTRCGTLLPP